MNYYMVYFKSNTAPADVIPTMAFVRATDEADAKRIMEENLDLRTHHVTEVSKSARHVITRQSLVINCHDVVQELERNLMFG